nr:M48 family peptidase [Betaproteobacteria bacterium]
MTPFDFSLIFVLLLATQFSVRLYLAQRQLRHVMQHRDQVPIAFGERISIENHQRAADYTRAKVSATIFEMLVHSLWLIVLTLGGLLTQIQSWIASVWLVWIPDELPGPGLAFQV